MSKRLKYPSVEYLKECFTYDGGVLYWKHRPIHHFKDETTYKKWNSKWAGKVAGYISHGRQQQHNVTINDKLHRRSILVWIYHGNVAPDNKQEIDHINVNSVDDRIENLRICTRIQNTRNTRKRKDNRSGYRGVGWSKPMNKWRARIKIESGVIILGYFDNPKEAYDVYCEAGRKYYGEFFNPGTLPEENAA